MGSSSRSLGTKGPSTKDPGKTKTVVMKTTGKLASEPKSGTGAQTKAPLAKASPVKDSLAPAKQPGRRPVPRKTGTSA